MASMLSIFLPLLIGYCIKTKSERWLGYSQKATSKLIWVILALMGLSLANIDNLSLHLAQIAKITLIFFVTISAVNLLCLPLLDKVFKTNTDQHQHSVPLLLMIKESTKLIFAVIFGLVIGLLSPWDISWVHHASEIILGLLLLLIGIQLGNSGIQLQQILLNKQGISIAVLILVSSWAGGAIASQLLDLPIKHALAMSSGFGWYSLSGILIGEHLGPVMGGASFLLELGRELTAIMLIPMIIKHYPLTAIGYGGATSMDFTLPIIQTHGGVNCVPIAIVSGFILSLLVPILILALVA